MYAVITENDVSQWNDSTGEFYHFPAKYKSILMPGTNVIYYKSAQKQKGYNRLTPLPHYFGVAKVDKITKVTNKNEYIAKIVSFESFEEPILAKQKGKYLEIIPENKRSNYWRDGVRAIDKNVFNAILNQVNIETENKDDFETKIWEGKKKIVYTSIYERSTKLRKLAIQIHGYTCMACGINFAEYYGEQFSKLIHIHHINPISEKGEAEVNPKTDLVPVCPNCHWVIHSIKGKILSVDQVRALIKSHR